jgi:hypothetical protein
MKRSAPADSQAEVRLADDSRVTIRPVAPGDRSLIAAAFAELSEDSRYRRFLTPLRELDGRQLAYLTELDHHDHEALLAIRLLERLGDATCEESGPELRFHVVLPDRDGVGPTLRELLRGAAAGLVAPARAFMERMSADDG